MECTRLDTKLAVAGAVRSGEFKAFELSSATETITSSFLWWLHAFFVPLHHFRDCIAVLLNTNFTQRYESKNRDTYKLHKSCDVSTLCQGFQQTKPQIEVSRRGAIRLGLCSYIAAPINAILLTVRSGMADHPCAC